MKAVHGLEVDKGQFELTVSCKSGLRWIFRLTSAKMPFHTGVTGSQAQQGCLKENLAKPQLHGRSTSVL